MTTNNNTTQPEDSQDLEPISPEETPASDNQEISDNAPETAADAPPVTDIEDDAPSPVADVAEVSPAPIIDPVPANRNEEKPMANTTPASASEQSVPVETPGKFEEWTVEPSSKWPPPVFLRRNASMRERFYLEYRWHSQWSYYDSKAGEAKSKYFWYQTIVIVGSLIIPALVGLNGTIARFINEMFSTGTGDDETIIRIGIDTITVFISLAVAGSAAIESLFKHGENWNSYRSAAEELQAEKNFYDMNAGPYENSQNAFVTFVSRIEGIVANQNGKYFQTVQAQIAKRSEDNENLVESFLSGGDDDETGDEYDNYASATSPNG